MSNEIHFKVREAKKIDSLEQHNNDLHEIKARMNLMNLLEEKLETA